MATGNPDDVPVVDVANVAIAVVERGQNSNRLPWYVLMRAELLACLFAMHAPNPIPYYERLDGLSRSYYDEMMRPRDPGDPPSKYRPFRRRRRSRRF